MAVVVLTGCSSGFGLEGALAFARNGDRVYATMRNERGAAELLRAAAAERLELETLTLDLARPDTFEPTVRRIIEQAGRIDVLVNNAGVNQRAAFEDTAPATLRAVMEVNCLGPLLLTQKVLPHMRRQRGGLIIMMSSLSGIAGLPGDVAYTASKFALEGATEALRHEVDRWGIRLALVQAGMYATRLFDNSLRPESLPNEGVAQSCYRPLIEHRLRAIHARLPQALDPRAVGELFVRIAADRSGRLRWPADETAVKVMGALFALDDRARDEFLRKAADCDWWSSGEAAG